MIPMPARLFAWVRRNVALLVTTLVAVSFVALTGVLIQGVYEERQKRTAQIEALARSNCEGINQTNETVRFILDGALRNRPLDAPPIPESRRRLYVDTYRRLPHTDCTTGVRTDFAPPFPS